MRRAASFKFHWLRFDDNSWPKFLYGITENTMWEIVNELNPKKTKSLEAFCAETATKETKEEMSEFKKLALKSLFYKSLKDNDCEKFHVVEKVVGKILRILNLHSRKDDDYIFNNLNKLDWTEILRYLSLHLYAVPTLKLFKSKESVSNSTFAQIKEKHDRRYLIKLSEGNQGNITK